MKLSWFECRFLANKLQELVDERKVTPSEQRHCDNLIPLFKRLAETPHSPDGRERDMEVPLETQLDEKIAELVNKENKAQEKIDLMEKIRANMTKVFWDYFFLTIKVVLIFTLLGATLYTIAHLVPKEWAIWAPLPIAAGLAFWEWCGSIFKRWYRGHWK